MALFFWGFLRAKGEKQVDSYAEFLLQHGTMHTRASELIGVVLTHASKFSLIESVFCVFKVRQFERLIILDMTLAQKLSVVDIGALIERL